MLERLPLWMTSMKAGHFLVDFRGWGCPMSSAQPPWHEWTGGMVLALSACPQFTGQLVTSTQAYSQSTSTAGEQICRLTTKSTMQSTAGVGGYNEGCETGRFSVCLPGEEQSLDVKGTNGARYQLRGHVTAMYYDREYGSCS